MEHRTLRASLEQRIKNLEDALRSIALTEHRLSGYINLVLNPTCKECLDTKTVMRKAYHGIINEPYEYESQCECDYSWCDVEDSWR